MMKRKLTALVLAAALALSCAACGTNGGSSSAEQLSAAAEDMFTDRDYEVGYSDCVTVTLADGASKSDGGGVTVSGDTVTVTAEGTYLLTGSLSSGQIVVDAADSAKIHLVLDNASVACTGGAALYIKSADKVFVTLAADSENTLSSAGAFDQSDGVKVDGAVFAKSDLTLNGSGSLAVTCAEGHGIVSKDDLKFTGGTYTVTAALQGLSGKDSVRIADGTFSVTAQTDAIHSENTEDADKGFVFISGGTFTLTSKTDGIDASGTVTVLDGTFEITSGGGSANAAVKAGDSGMGGTPPSGTAPSGEKPSGTAPSGGQGGTPPSGTAPSGEKPSGTPPSGGQGGTPPQKPSEADTSTSATPAADATAAASGAAASSAAADTASCKGIKSDAGITISGGTFTIDSADDSIHTNGSAFLSGGTISITSGDDGIHADAALEISGGTISITESYEGLEGASVTVSGGKINLTASDDGLNAAGGNDGSSISGRTGQNTFDADTSASITISGGTLTVNAGGDGIDSNGTLTVSGGTTFVSGPTNSGNGALDYGSSASISGGILIAAGAVGMAQNFGSDSSQGSILCTLSSVQAAGTAVTLTDADGTVLASYAPAKEYQSVVISAPGVKAGGTYTLTAGSETQTIKMTDTIYGAGDQGMAPGGKSGQAPAAAS
ncbi:MAG: carbohydrate-binding domain-containing protein [Oscillibacter sp.]|jgi:hypothetical protein|nr:carbohydrate-binding domain-containing protein [Oscillibacter sp.]